MPFPVANRCIYRKNPLDMVVCQLRFPPILKIDSSLPADFQDRVRVDFPNFTDSSEFKVELPPVMGEQIPPEVFRQFIQSSGGKNYEFSSLDGNWKINLSRTFISLTTTKYERWENFREKLMLPFTALQEVYSPNYFSRIGLRYIDVIRRSNIGLTGVPWSELLSSTLIGMYSSLDTANYVDRLDFVQEIHLTENVGNARIISKIIKESEEDVFVIDSDYFDIAQIERNSALNKLDSFNKRSSRFIRWAITDRLHEALEPQLI
jgi:uncharacterized protein (TIGR04255 family)